MTNALGDGNAGQVRREAVAEGLACGSGYLPPPDGEAVGSTSRCRIASDAAVHPRAVGSAVRLVANTLGVAALRRRHLSARLPCQADGPKVEGREVTAIAACPRVEAVKRARDGVAVVEAPVPRRPGSCHKEDESEGRPLAAVDVARGAAPGMTEAIYVELGRVAVGRPRQVGTRVRVGGATRAIPNPAPHPPAMGMEADVVSVARPASRALHPLRLEASGQGRVKALASALTGSKSAPVLVRATPASLVAHVPGPLAVGPCLPHLADNAEDEVVATAAERVALVIRALGVSHRALDRRRQVVVLVAAVRRSDRIGHVRRRPLKRQAPVAETVDPVPGKSRAIDVTKAPAQPDAGVVALVCAIVPAEAPNPSARTPAVLTRPAIKTAGLVR